MAEFPLLRSLFDDAPEERKPLSVSELNAQVRAALESRFANVWIEGEIVNFAAANSGHWYFTLHDGASQLRAACYRGSNSRIKFEPFDGLQVRVRGRLTLYEPRGEYQILIESLEPVGEGALRVAYEQIKAKLKAEGLFDDELKRPLPAFPRKIGVVTSPTGAAFFDILHVLSRRARSVRVVLIPTRVQGERAGDEIRAAILSANKFNKTCKKADRLDVLIVGRGGGSREDLWSFNDEHVARAIRGSAIPVISAVGHEIDFTIADLVADVRAATPSAAAEMVAAREEDVLRLIESHARSLERNIENRLLFLENELQNLELSPVFAEFPAYLDKLKCTVDDQLDSIRQNAAGRMRKISEQLNITISRMTPLALTARLAKTSEQLAVIQQRNDAAFQTNLRSRENQLDKLMAKLDSLSPLSVLDRGYSITERAGGQIVRQISDVASGDRLTIRLSNGKLEAEVITSEE